MRSWESSVLVLGTSLSLIQYEFHLHVSVSRTVSGTLADTKSHCSTVDYVSTSCLFMVVEHNENMYCVYAWYMLTTLCLTYKEGVTSVFIFPVNAHNPNGFQYSLFTSRIKLFTENSSCPRLTLKAWFTTGFCVSPQKHDIGAVTRIFKVLTCVVSNSPFPPWTES